MRRHIRSTPAVVATILLLGVLVSGCDLVGDVIEFGFWTGVVVVGLVVLVVWGIARSLRRRP